MLYWLQVITDNRVITVKLNIVCYKINHYVITDMNFISGFSKTNIIYNESEIDDFSEQEKEDLPYLDLNSLREHLGDLKSIVENRFLI